MFLKAAPASASPPPVFNVVDLGVAPGSEDGGKDINESGQIALILNGAIYRWDNGTAVPIGLSSINGPLAINRLGHIAASANLQAWFWPGSGAVRELLPSQPGYAMAHDLNDNDVAVGNVFGPIIAHDIPLVWEGDSVRELPTSPSIFDGFATAINNTNQIVGVQDDRATIWNNDVPTLLPMLPEHTRSHALALNNQGHVVGFSRPLLPGDQRAVLWHDGEVIDLGVLPRRAYEFTAYGINERSSIVGRGLASGGDRGHGFLWHDGELYDLNHRIEETSGWTITRANSINDAMQIVGVGYLDGVQHAVLLNPAERTSFDLGIASTAFEEPAQFAVSYDPDSVNGTELGFDTVETATGGAQPLVGVLITGEGPEHLMRHQSRAATTTLHPVDLADWDEVTVSVDVQVSETTFEEGDFLRVFATDGVQTLNLVQAIGATGADPLDALADGDVHTFTMSIPNQWAQVSLVLASSSNSSTAAERFSFDNIEFRGYVAIPEPSTIGLLALGMIAWTIRWITSVRSRLTAMRAIEIRRDRHESGRRSSRLAAPLMAVALIVVPHASAHAELIARVERRDNVTTSGGSLTAFSFFTGYHLTPSLWQIQGVTTADIGRTYTASPSIVSLLESRLTNGVDETFSMQSLGVSESTLFHQVPGGHFYHAAFQNDVGGFNGVDLAGYDIDGLTLTIDQLSYTHRDNGMWTDWTSGSTLLVYGRPTAPLDTSYLVPRQAVWRYWDNGTSPGAEWRELDFDDSTWQEGAAPLGYGEGDEQTVIYCGPTAPACNDDNLATAYFRREFDVSDPSAIDELRLTMVRDDAVAAYVNGVEVFRDTNLAANADFSTYTVPHPVENVSTTISIPTTHLLSGRNVLALEVHQADPNIFLSSIDDLSFDARLVEVTVIPEPTSGVVAGLACAIAALGWRIKRRLVALRRELVSGEQIFPAERACDVGFAP
jgi:probable HAF family extracellular repeat protein